MFKRRRAAVLAASVVALAWVCPASAQNVGDIRALAAQIQELRGDLNILQRDVYGPGGRPPRGAVEGAGGVGQAGQAAQFEIRLNTLEEEIRALTGMVERIEHEVVQARARTERLAEDLDFRVEALERGAAGAAGAAAAAPVTPQAPAEVPLGGAPGAAGAQILGVLPANPAGAAGAAAPPPPTPREQYEAAYALLAQFRIAEAETAWLAFLAAHPEHELATNARYWLGETHYADGDYREAALTFFEGYEDAPEGKKAPDNLLKLAMSLARMEQTQEACAALVELDLRFPEAPAAIRNPALAERRRLNCP